MQIGICRYEPTIRRLSHRRTGSAALPRLAAVVVGIWLMASEHLVLDALGVLVLGTAVWTNWRNWGRYVRCGQRVPNQPSDAFGQPGSFRVELIEAGPRPIEVIKAVGEVTASGHPEAKRVVDSVPSVVAADLSAESRSLSFSPQS